MIRLTIKRTDTNPPTEFAVYVDDKFYELMPRYLVSLQSIEETQNDQEKKKFKIRLSNVVRGILTHQSANPFSYNEFYLARMSEDDDSDHFSFLLANAQQVYGQLKVPKNADRSDAIKIIAVEEGVPFDIWPEQQTTLNQHIKAMEEKRERDLTDARNAARNVVPVESDSIAPSIPPIDPNEFNPEPEDVFESFPTEEHHAGFFVTEKVKKSKIILDGLTTLHRQIETSQIPATAEYVAYREALNNLKNPLDESIQKAKEAVAGAQKLESDLFDNLKPVYSTKLSNYFNLEFIKTNLAFALYKGARAYFVNLQKETQNKPVERTKRTEEFNQIFAGIAQCDITTGYMSPAVNMPNIFIEPKELSLTEIQEKINALLGKCNPSPMLEEVKNSLRDQSTNSEKTEDANEAFKNELAQEFDFIAWSGWLWKAQKFTWTEDALEYEKEIMRAIEECNVNARKVDAEFHTKADDIELPDLIALETKAKHIVTQAECHAELLEIKKQLPELHARAEAVNVFTNGSSFEKTFTEISELKILDETDPSNHLTTVRRKLQHLTTTVSCYETLWNQQKPRIEELRETALKTKNDIAEGMKAVKAKATATFFVFSTLPDEIQAHLIRANQVPAQRGKEAYVDQFRVDEENYAHLPEADQPVSASAPAASTNESSNAARSKKPRGKVLTNTIDDIPTANPQEPKRWVMKPIKRRRETPTSSAINNHGVDQSPHLTDSKKKATISYSSDVAAIAAAIQNLSSVSVLDETNPAVALNNVIETTNDLEKSILRIRSKLDECQKRSQQLRHQNELFAAYTKIYAAKEDANKMLAHVEDKITATHETIAQVKASSLGLNAEQHAELFTRINSLATTWHTSSASSKADIKNKTDTLASEVTTITLDGSDKNIRDAQVDAITNQYTAIQAIAGQFNQNLAHVNEQLALLKVEIADTINTVKRKIEEERLAEEARLREQELAAERARLLEEKRVRDEQAAQQRAAEELKTRQKVEAAAIKKAILNEQDEDDDDEISIPQGTHSASSSSPSVKPKTEQGFFAGLLDQHYFGLFQFTFGAAGAAAGVAIGFPLAPATLGLSIVVCAFIGAAVGFVAGLVMDGIAQCIKHCYKSGEKTNSAPMENVLERRLDNRAQLDSSNNNELGVVANTNGQVQTFLSNNPRKDESPKKLSPRKKKKSPAKVPVDPKTVPNPASVPQPEQPQGQIEIPNDRPPASVPDDANGKLPVRRKLAFGLNPPSTSGSAPESAAGAAPGLVASGSTP